MSAIGVVFIIFGIAFIVAGFFMLCDEEPMGLLVIIGAGLTLVAGCGILSMDDSTAAVQQAADKQGIEVVISDGGHDVTTKSPCTLRLDLQNGELVLDGTNNVITKDKLATICATLAK